MYALEDSEKSITYSYSPKFEYLGKLAENKGNL